MCEGVESLPVSGSMNSLPVSEGVESVPVSGCVKFASE